MTVYHDTHITYGQTPRTIVLHNVLSISESKSTDGEPANVHQTKCDIVEVEFDEATSEHPKDYIPSSAADKAFRDVHFDGRP